MIKKLFCAPGHNLPSLSSLALRSSFSPRSFPSVFTSIIANSFLSEEVKVTVNTQLTYGIALLETQSVEVLSIVLVL